MENTPGGNPRLIPATTAAVILGVTLKTVHNWVHQGQLVGEFNHGRWFIVYDTVRTLKVIRERRQARIDKKYGRTPKDGAA